MLNAAFSFQTAVTTETFLGPYVAPEDLTPSRAAEHADGSFGKAIAEANFSGSYILARFRILQRFMAGVQCFRAN